MAQRSILSFFTKRPPQPSDPKGKQDDVSKKKAKQLGLNGDGDGLASPKVSNDEPKRPLKKRPRSPSGNEAMNKTVEETESAKRHRPATEGEEENVDPVPSKVVKKVISSAPSTPPSTKYAASPSTSGSLDFPHLQFEFLNPPRDADGRSIGDDGYNPSTLEVPRDFLGTLTPGMRQWWELKRKHFDSLLFFKMGKFYELFHMDAVTAVEACDLVYMKKDIAHCGFPESAFSQYADLLVDKGHRIIRIEQTETPQMMTERCKKLPKATKFDKVVKREVCQMISAGTRISPPSDSDESLHSLLTIGSCGQKTMAAILYPQIGHLYVGTFTDDADNFANTATFLSFMKPSEILTDAEASSVLHKVTQEHATLRNSKVILPASSWLGQAMTTEKAALEFCDNLPQGKY